MSSQTLSPLAAVEDSANAVERLCSSILDCIHRPIKKSSLFLFALFLLCLCGIRAYVGFDGMNAYSHDLFFFLDGGWRVLHGQIPYNDFFTDAGPLIHLHSALGLLLAHGRAEGLAYPQALVGFSVGLWAYLLARGRLAPLFALLFVWTIVLLTISPSVIGDPPTEMTSAGIYNRYGYSFIALIILEAFYAGRPSSRASAFLDGFSSGTATALLLFIKISYFLAAGFFLLAMLPCGKQVRTRWAGITAGFVAGFAPVFIYMRCDLAPMWNDLRFLASAKHISVLPFTLPGAISATCQMSIILLLAIAVLVENRALSEVRRLVITGCLVIGGGILLLLGNFQRGRLPLLAVIGLLLVQQVERRSYGRSHAHLLLRTAVALWCCVFIAGSIALDTASLGYALGFRIARGNTHGPLFDSPRLTGFQDVEIGYVALVNDGIALLQKYRQPSETVASLDFSNPFTYALGIPPIQGGGPGGLHYRANFDDQHKLPPEFYFGHADLVMVPVAFTDGTLQDSIPRIYGPYLQRHFHEVGQSVGWHLYRNNRSREK